MSINHEKECDALRKDDIMVSVKNGQEVLQVGARLGAERRLVRKLDCRLLPTVVIIFFMHSIDRIAITSARLQGLQTDLGLSDVQYDTAVAILYASYCPTQIPSNVALNYISKPSFYIGACVVLWGLTSALTGTVHSFAGIVVCRLFVGFPEAAFYPGAIYLLSSWYTRKELASRSAVLYSGLLISNAFGNLWAAGIFGGMNGAMGIAAWRWLFYIEGTVTILIGFLAMWLLPDYVHSKSLSMICFDECRVLDYWQPFNTRWFSPAERHLAQVRLAEDAAEADKDSQQASILEGLKLALKDPKIPIFMLMDCSQLLGLSFTNFFPTLTATLGYSTIDTLLMAAPPWVYAAIVAIINARHADVSGERYFHLSIGWWVAIIGYIISLSTMKTAARYFSMFLMTSGFCGASLILVWVANSIPRPPAKRSAAIALVNGFGNLGNLMGSYIWKANWGPEYHPSMIICLSAFAFASCLGFVIRILLVRENKRMERVEMDSMHGPERERVEEAARLEGITFDEAVRRRMGFRYLY